MGDVRPLRSRHDAWPSGCLFAWPRHGVWGRRGRRHEEAHGLCASAWQAPDYGAVSSDEVHELSSLSAS